MARPCGLKIPPLMPSRSFRSIPALRGTAPTSRATEEPKGRHEVARRLDVDEKGKAQSSSSITTLERLHARLDLEQAQHDRLVLAEHLGQRESGRATSS